MLPKGDRTPREWAPPDRSMRTTFKRALRRALYPAYLCMINPILRRYYDPNNDLDVNQWYWGHRGLELDLIRRRLDRLIGIKGKRVLIAGCGTGRDIPSWLDYSPRELTGVDYFSYERAWAILRKRTKVPIKFIQSDLAELASVSSGSQDIVGSDAVLEHVQNLTAVLKELHRILTPGGILYATFGPLWYCWGGDHVSGFDKLEHGYNHLLLSESQYKAYLDTRGPYAHSEHDGRTWIKNGLFSYLRLSEYITELRACGFEKLYLGLVIDPRAVRTIKTKPELGAHLQQRYELTQLDLIVTGVSLIYRRLDQ